MMKRDYMVRRNVTFSRKDDTFLAEQRKKTGVPTAMLLRQLIEKHRQSLSSRKKTDRRS